MHKQNAPLTKGYQSFDNNEFSSAIRHFKQCLAIDANDVEALVNMGISLTMLDLCENALPYFESALALDPDMEIYASYSTALLQTGRMVSV